MSAPVVEFMRFSAPDAQAHAQSIEAHRDKLRLAQLAGDRLATLDSVADLAGLLVTARFEAEAFVLMQNHTSTAEAMSDQEPAAWFWNAYATALQYLGRRAQADQIFDKTLRMCLQGDWQRLRAVVLHHWGRNLAEQGHFAEAQARFVEALALRINSRDPLQESSRFALEALAARRADPQR